MVPLSHGLIFSTVLFILGLFGVVAHCNFLFMLFSLEIMLNSVALMFVLIGNYLGQEDGQVIYILIITVAAAEAGVCLSLLLRLYSYFHTLDLNKISRISR